MRQTLNLEALLGEGAEVGVGSSLLLLQGFELNCRSFLSLFDFGDVSFIVDQVVTDVFLNSGPTKFKFVR